MRSIASIIQEILSEGYKPGPPPLALVEGAWPGVVGNDIAVLSQICALDDGFLVVESLHPAAAFEIRSREGEFVARLRADTGMEIRAIRIRPAGRRS